MSGRLRRPDQPKDEGAAVEALRRELVRRGALEDDATAWHGGAQPIGAVLRRFLRARKGEVAAAADMFERQVEWRRSLGDGGVDSIERWFDFPEKASVRELYPAGYFRTCKQGRPVYCERLGRVDIEALAKVCSVDRLVLYHVLEYEFLMRHHLPELQARLPEEKRWEVSSTQTVTILDLAGLHFGNLKKSKGMALDYFRRVKDIDSDCYPEMLGRLLVINAPFAFRAIWSLLRPMVPRETLSKVSIHGTDFEKALHSLVSPADLPPSLGGSDESLELGTCLSDEYHAETHLCADEESADAASQSPTGTDDDDTQPVPPRSLGRRATKMVVKVGSMLASPVAAPAAQAAFVRGIVEHGAQHDI
mmetsp:Transcript_15160/g.63038  ORF Transcript_15160/g.63038 Transcript_15160/m.63038 type:complete len:363 (+) Transcript_15160:510-1598(+)